jgi:hypothetical protein
MRDFVPKSEGYLDYLPAAVDRVIAQVRVERKLLESERGWPASSARRWTRC